MTTAATTLYLSTGQVRTVKGRAEDVSIALRPRAMTKDDDMRQFVTTDGDTITVNRGAIALVEPARDTYPVGFWTD